MWILGIETSCDETAAAVIEITGPKVRPRISILSNVISSQAKLHAKFGGVVPNLAKREHQKNLVPILLHALCDAGLWELRTKNRELRKPRQYGRDSKFLILNSILERESELLAQVEKKVLPLRPPKIDAIAVTVGPGLAPALWVGVNFARALAYIWKKPIIPVNHLEGHIYTNLLGQIGKLKTQNSKLKTFEFPVLCLIVSGGHTELVLMHGYRKYKIIGETLDDAAGEAFDKVAKMLGLGFPGGPEIAAHAAKVKTKSEKLKIKLPRPMINADNFDFSFSGLKTAVLYALRDLTVKFPLAKIRSVMAREFQNAVVDVLVSKTIKAAKRYKVKTVMIGGGVAANQKLRAELGKALKHSSPGTCYLTPDPSLTGDNALMIALAGYFSRNKKTAWRVLQADANLRLGRS